VRPDEEVAMRRNTCLGLLITTVLACIPAARAQRPTLPAQLVGGGPWLLQTDGAARLVWFEPSADGQLRMVRCHEEPDCQGPARVADGNLSIGKGARSGH
jgi:hypothetical protein